MATKLKKDSSPAKEKQKDDDFDSEDELLAQAAAQWASNEQDTTTTSTSPHQPHVEPPYKPLSLHVTQLSFDATEYHVRNAFVEQGCIVDSVRLVYDRDGTTRTFRGVAFVDVADEESYQKALKLDRSTLLKRRINVRPTKTPQQLSNIVQRTKDLVAEKIRKEREQDTPSPKSRSTDKRKKASHDSKKKKTVSSTKDAVHKKSSSTKKHKNTGGKVEDSDRKLTKKERNRRAAIIMQRKRGKR